MTAAVLIKEEIERKKTVKVSYVIMNSLLCIHSVIVYDMYYAYDTLWNIHVMCRLIWSVNWRRERLRLTALYIHYIYILY